MVLLQAAPALAEVGTFLARALAAAPEAGPRIVSPRRDLFNEIIRESMLAHFDAKTTRSLHYTIEAFGNGFEAARQGKLSTATLEFARGDELLALLRQTQPPQVLQFLSCRTLPYRAYDAYRRGHFDTARDLTLAAIASIEQLEDLVPVLHIARVQQVHNLSRVSFRQGDTLAGAGLVGELLGYLGGGPAPARAGEWPARLLDRTPPTLRADMLGQIFLEMADHLLTSPAHAERAQLFAQAFEPLAGPLAQHTQWAAYAAWVVAYGALLRQEAPEYEPHLVAYLARPGHQHDLLKLALLLELRRGLPPGAAPALEPLLGAYARRTLWVPQRHLGLLA